MSAGEEPLLGRTDSTRRCGRCCTEAVSLLRWSMLAACTVGPGTVVVCAKAGADFDLRLMWTLLFASLAAFVMQSQAARLTIESGISFGQAIRLRFDGDASTGDNVPFMAWVALVGVLIGNSAYTANCFVGALGALHVLFESNWWFNITVSVVTAAITLVALLCANLDQLGKALGVCILAMTVVFALTASRVVVNGSEFGRGLLPDIPGGSSRTVLSMVGTTAIPFNMFLAASMTSGSDLGQATRGIGFASLLTAVISILIVIVGSAIVIEDPNADFTIEDLGNQIGKQIGETGKIFFCIGLYAAAYSSAITCPLGAALTAQQILSEGREESASNARQATRLLSQQQLASYERLSLRKSHQSLSPHRKFSLAQQEKAVQRWKSGGTYFNGSMIVIVCGSAVVSSSPVSTVGVIILAQVINGLLLPIISICLALCINDETIVAAPPSVLGNILLMAVVYVTLFLAFHLIADEVATFPPVRPPPRYYN